MRRVDGVVVYLNGVELWRDNLNFGNVLATNASRFQVDGEILEKQFTPCGNCRRNNSALLKVNFMK